MSPAPHLKSKNEREMEGAATHLSDAAHHLGEAFALRPDLAAPADKEKMLEELQAVTARLQAIKAPATELNYGHKRLHESYAEGVRTSDVGDFQQQIKGVMEAASPFVNHICAMQAPLQPEHRDAPRDEADNHLDKARRAIGQAKSRLNNLIQTKQTVI